MSILLKNTGIYPFKNLIMGINWNVILEDGLTITIVGYVIVFLALVVLYLVFTWLARSINFFIRRRLKRKGMHVNGDGKSLMIEGDVAAAISMAIYIYHELHDEESNVITIERVSRTYSPWSSKIYSLRQ